MTANPANSTPDADGDDHDPRAVMTAIAGGDITTVIVGGCDLNGVFRAKRIPARRFASSDEPAVEFSEYMWAIDIDDFPQPRPSGFEGYWPDWANGFGDIVAVADLTTLRRVPWLQRTAVVLCDYRFPDGRAYDIAPRHVLSRVVQRLEGLGLEPRMAAEYEFCVFRETEQSALDKVYRGLQPLAPQAWPYGALRATIDDSVIGPIAEALGQLGLSLEAWNPEGAPGQYELNLCHQSALEAADQGFLFKHGVKELCALDGMLATFAPKLAGGGFGSSLHVHQSIWRDGSPAFYDQNGSDGMSPLMRQFIAGQLQTLAEFAPIWQPTPLSFKRPQAYLAAGTTESWGLDNKTLSLRAVVYEPHGYRVEHRVPGADANIYLTFAAMLAGGLYGIERELELAPATTGDAYANPDLKTLPRNMDAAIGRFEQSAVANEYLGEKFVSHFAATRRWELECSQQEATDWELTRYFVRI